MKILHILNGDSTAESFNDTGLDGDIIVWNAVLSEGPVEENTASGSFWKARMAFICEAFGETPEGYQKKMLDGLVKLSEPWDEINLWFEFDLHCQLNMLGVMTYLKKQTNLSQPAIYLICPSDYPGKENFRGIGELNGEELEYLYDNIRVQLSAIDFIVAEEAWSIYVSKDAGKLRDYLNTNNFWGSLHLLKPALQAQLKRLQLNKNGLNDVEQKLLDIYNGGAKTREQLYAAFWQTEKIYGMGDMEINLHLNRLQEKLPGTLSF